jgi:tRNA threonylcarbamoyl adenosine modification protein YeaZ
MKILALEFSSALRSVALLNFAPDGRVLTRSEVVDASPANSVKPFEMIEQALRETGLEREAIKCIAVGIGPGSYTGIRAAIALAQGWQLAIGVKLLGISSAECIATQAWAEGIAGRLSVVIDAQRDEFYLASYETTGGGLEEVSALRLATRVEVEARAQAGDTLLGPDVAQFGPSAQKIFPGSLMLGGLARGRTDFVPGNELAPIYLREANFVKAPPPRNL